jgi:hypothetical protein
LTSAARQPRARSAFAPGADGPAGCGEATAFAVTGLFREFTDSSARINRT